MPRYKVQATHWLILEGEISIEASDRAHAEEIAGKIRDRGSLGEGTWEVHGSVIPGWQELPQTVEIEVEEE